MFRKKITGIITLIIGIMLIGAFTSCGGDNPCTHTGGTATCVAKAICKNCSEPYGDLNPNNHDFSNNAETCRRNGCDEPNPNYEPQCIHTGGTATCTDKAICTKCNQAYGNALGHNFTGLWESDATQHWKKCSNGTCQTISGNGTTESSKANHTWGNWVITDVPTSSLDGEETKFCSICNRAGEICALSETTFKTYFFGTWIWEGTDWISNDIQIPMKRTMIIDDNKIIFTGEYDSSSQGGWTFNITSWAVETNQRTIFWDGLPFTGYPGGFKLNGSFSNITNIPATSSWDITHSNMQPVTEIYILMHKSGANVIHGRYGRSGPYSMIFTK